MSERVSLRVDDHVAHVRLNRPDKRNGLDHAMFVGLIEAGEQIMARNDVRAVVLAGEGACFCAGLDFVSFVAMGADGPKKLLAREMDSPANLAQRASYVWQEVPVPVIAAVHGPTFGGGLQIALGADIRIGAPDTEMSVMEIRWGIIPDMGITKLLPKHVRMDVAKELTFTGRRVKAEEAQALGLLTRVADDPIAAASELAGEIATKNPHAIRAGKTLFNTAPDLPVDEAFKLESALQVPLLGSKNQLEAVQANFQKRAPKFDDVT